MEITEKIKQICINARTASKTLANSSGEARNGLLIAISEKLAANADGIIAANALDLNAAKENGMRESMLDRLALNEGRINAIAAAVKKVAALPDPLGSGEVTTRPNGLKIEKTRVPLGVVAIIYEARPNVTPDAVCLCLKSGNAVVLRGGKEAINSNKKTVALIRETLTERGFDPNCVCLIEDTSRDGANALMKMRGLVDVLIPRGGKGLIKNVVENASVPVIETGAGNCHLYVDESANIDMAVNVAVNAKCSRPSVCNAIETVLVHAAVADEFLPRFYDATRFCNLEFRGCDRTRKILDGITAATEEDYATEYDDYIVAVKVVDSVEEATEHIGKYSTGHSEAIITESARHADYFVKNIDSCALYVNASTRFTDGEEFGLGAEIGISTQKLHARGPMGLDALTTIKYYVTGDGNVR